MEKGKADNNMNNSGDDRFDEVKSLQGLNFE